MWVHVHKLSLSSNTHYLMLPEHDTEYAGDYLFADFINDNATSSIHVTINLAFSERQQLPELFMLLTCFITLFETNSYNFCRC